MQPGVAFFENVVEVSARDDGATAIPVLVGYTERGGAQSGQPPELVSIASISEYDALFGGPPDASSSGRGARCMLYFAVRHYFDNEGGRCFVAAVGSYEDAARQRAEEAADTLASAALFDAIVREPAVSLVAIPDLAVFDDEERTSHLAVWERVLEACERNRTIFAVLDSPASLAGAQACRDWLKSAQRSGAIRGAAYWPHLVSDYVRYPVNRDGAGERVVIPPSAAVAAVMHQTDKLHGIWKAPANVTIQHVVRPEYPFREGEKLFDADGASINLIRSFPGRGIRVWGCRTLANSGNTPWRYIQVRRLATYIESSLAEAARFAVFEPNHEITWVKLKGMARAWLRRLWLNGGLFGREESEAFQIAVGIGESMTEVDVRAGLMIMHVRFAPLYPAEFIEITVTLTATANQAASATSNQNRSLLV